MSLQLVNKERRNIHVLQYISTSMIIACVDCLLSLLLWYDFLYCICILSFNNVIILFSFMTLRLINVYNLCSLFIIFIEESSTISRLNELIKDDCEQLIVEDFNLHHSHWKDRRCFTHHIAIDALLDIITNVRLNLLLESDIITKETHN